MRDIYQVTGCDNDVSSTLNDLSIMWVKYSNCAGLFSLIEPQVHKRTSQRSKINKYLQDNITTGTNN